MSYREWTEQTASGFLLVLFGALLFAVLFVHESPAFFFVIGGCLLVFALYAAWQYWAIDWHRR